MESFKYFATLGTLLCANVVYLLISWKTRRVRSIMVLVSILCSTMLFKEAWREMQIYQSGISPIITEARARDLFIEGILLGGWLIGVLHYAEENLKAFWRNNRSRIIRTTTL